MVLNVNRNLGKQEQFKICCLIPVYNNAATISVIIRELVAKGLPCFVVNDGSNDQTSHKLGQLNDELVELIELPSNRGKGFAVVTALRCAWQAGFSHAIQIDADGQHDLSDLPHFIEAAKKNPKALICGQPIFDQDAPLVRVYGRKLSIWLSWLETLSKDIGDILCGYRVYPLESCAELLAEREIGSRMEFDTEIAIRLYWSGLTVLNLPTKISYPPGGVSHFRMLADNFRIALLHLRLLAELPFQLPALLSRKLHKGSQKQWFALEERGSPLAIRLGATILRTVGRSAFVVIFYPIIIYFFLTAAKHRAGSRRYLKQLRASQAENRSNRDSPSSHGVFAHFVQFGQMVVDRVLAWSNAIPLEAINWHGLEDLKALIAKGQGGIFLGAHFGSLEVARSLTEKIAEIKVNALLLKNFAGKLGSVRDDSEAGASSSLLDIADLSPASIVKMKECIAAGEFIALLGDRVAAGTPDRRRFANFLGKPAGFPEGPWVLASLLDCPVFLVFCIRENSNKYQVYFEKFTDKVKLKRGEREDSLQDYIQRYADRLAHYCHKAPLQWFNLYDFWETDTTVTDPST